MITNSASQFIFAAMKRGDYLPFAERNAREEFSCPITVCAWCPDAKERTRLAMIANGGRAVSHGMCPACSAKLNAEMDK
jgi:hypothetical protein